MWAEKVISSHKIIMLIIFFYFVSLLISYIFNFLGYKIYHSQKCPSRLHNTKLLSKQVFNSRWQGPFWKLPKYKSKLDRFVATREGLNYVHFVQKLGSIFSLPEVYFSGKRHKNLINLLRTAFHYAMETINSSVCLVQLPQFSGVHRWTASLCILITPSLSRSTK